MSEAITNKNISSGFDIIGDVLETLRFHGTVFLRSELAAPWGLLLGEIKAPRFHIMLSGHCYMGMEDEQPNRINDMEIMMLPNTASLSEQAGKTIILNELENIIKFSAL
ncbi:MAG: hypothetical protein GQ546_02650 [Gammaproteobacteria bacterium]|nr:hypothetical protein [Gammaproteobacteria bacterium]